MVSFAQLRDAKLEPLSDAVTAWTNLVKKLESAEDDYRDKLLKPLRDSRWRGKAASAALRTLIPFTQYFRVSATEASAIASVLHFGHRQFAAAQRKLKGAIEEASGLRLSVGEDGSVRLPPMDPSSAKNPESVKYWDRLKFQAGQIHGQLAAAVKEATEADQRISQALGRLGAEILDRPNSGVDAAADARMAAKLAGFDKNNIPPKGVDTPKEAAAWWKGLPEEQRHLMINAFPEKIGWLNGIPSEDRDEANRVGLANRVAELETKKDQGHIYPHEYRELRRLETMRFQLGRLDEAGKDPYLLGVDTRVTTTDGRAIVAIGNPDNAKHTGVLVPGITNDIDNFGTTLDRADRLSAQANQYAPGEVSTIAWLGYDAPGDHTGLPGHPGAFSYAEQGAPALSQTVDGIRQAQSDAGLNNGHITAIGHSYGSVVVGEAATRGGLHVNDIVTAGSPGVHASHASELNVGADHVWAARGSGDFVPSLGPFAHGGDWGVVPSDPNFGANAMRTDTAGHGEYWNYRPGTHEASESLANQARVIAGRYDDVTRAGGTLAK